MKCVTCGTDIQREGAFCPTCGNKLAGPTPLQHPAPSASIPNEATRPLTAYAIAQEPTLPLFVKPAPPIAPPHFATPLPVLPEHLPVTPLPIINESLYTATPALSHNTNMTKTTRQKRQATLLITISILLLALAVGGLAGMLFLTHEHALNTPRAAAAAAPLAFLPTVGPSGQRVNTHATSIIFNPKTSRNIDNNYQPAQLTDTFSVGQVVYVTFQIASNGKPGAIEARWYNDGRLVSSGHFTHSPHNSIGLFSDSYSSPGQGTVELYWCSRTDCSDAQLAQVVSFTVTAASTSLDASTRSSLA